MMNNVVDITARLPSSTMSPLDIEEGIDDPEIVESVDTVEQLVQASARQIAIELVRRGCARLDLYRWSDGQVCTVMVEEA